MSTGVFQQVQDLRQTESVRMDEVRLLVFGHQGKFVLLTEDLNGCSGVVIFSQAAAILAHIPPRPNADLQDPYAGEKNVQRRMGEVVALFRTYRTYFTTANDKLVISAMYQGQTALPHQKVMIERSLQQMGLTYANKTYVVLKPGEPRSNSHGTIVIDARGGRPMVYIDDQLVVPNSNFDALQGQPSVPRQSMGIFPVAIAPRIRQSRGHWKSTTSYTSATTAEKRPGRAIVPYG